MELSEKFALKWNNYQTHLTSRFQNLQQLEEFTDVTLYCEDKKIKAHKVILAACSPYFQDIFEDFAHSQSAIIFRDVNYNDLAALMRFIYTGEAEVTQEMLPSFIKTAHLLKMHGLTNIKYNEKAQPSTSCKRPKSPVEPEKTATSSDEVEEIGSPPTAFCEIDIDQPDLKRVKSEPDEHSDNDSQNEALNIAAGLIDGTEDVLEIDQELAASWLPASMLADSQESLLIPKTEPNSGNEKNERNRYECQTCGKGFGTYDRLRVHTDVHEGLTKCTICGQTLSRKDSLRRHMKIKHPVIPYAPMNSDSSKKLSLGGPV